MGSRPFDLVVILFAAAIFLGCMFSPPHLMDDVDAVHAQIARNMLQSGDWVTARLNGIAYLEKSPLGYWMTATSFRLFGVHDWAGRLPLMFSVITLCWITQRFGKWAFGAEPGFYAGLVLSTCIGLFLFTRILIPDAILTLMITLALWSVLRALEPSAPESRMWSIVAGVCLGLGLLLKGLIAVVFPVGATCWYLLFTRQLFSRNTWRRLRPVTTIVIALVIALPWHILATLRNPPFFDFTMHSGSGQYHGFFWFYFINEHVLRFLNLRYPRDYNTVPRSLFWLLHFIWLFPWSFYAMCALRLEYRSADRASRTRLMALCWIGVVLVFFSFSTTQEYYSLPAYPAFALLLGSAMSTQSIWIRRGRQALIAVTAIATVIIAVILWKVWTLPAPGDISAALVQHPELYTLSLGHVGDLTLRSFAYLRLPLVIAGIAAIIGGAGMWVYRTETRKSFLAAAIMMVVFFHAARIAMVTFDPYMGSKPLTDALMAAPPGKLIEADAYYAFSSVFFYTNRTALLWNGRTANLEYGSYAPGAPRVFIDDAEFQRAWCGSERYYLLADSEDLPRIEDLVGRSRVHVMKASGGKYLLTNRAITPV